MTWKEIIADLKATYDQMEKAGPPLPASLESNMSAQWEYFRTFLIDSELRSSKEIGKICGYFARTGQWPRVLTNDVYMVTQRFASAIALAAVLTTPAPKHLGWENIQPEQYPSFLLPPSDNPALVKEWLLVCAWERMGRSRWVEQMELHFLRKRVGPEGTY